MKKLQRYRLNLDEWLPDRLQKNLERTPVTVCIAAICRNIVPTEAGLMVVGAADRMLTGGEIEFEPKIPNKILHFSSAITGMFAGDFGLQTEVVRKVLPVVKERIAAEPANWWAVSDIAEMYAQAYKGSHLKRAENAVLAPLGLDINSFYAKQKGMDSELVKQIASKLAQFHSPEVEAIFCGLDLTGAHIYIVDNSANVSCHDVVGFAAIGAGYWHADSQFMFANHTPYKSFAETLLLTYSAKKRAEVAPGVGSDTDMFSIGPLLGNHIPNMAPHVLEKLNQMYLFSEKKKHQADEKAQIEIGKYIDGIIKKTAEQKKKQETTSPSTTAPVPPSEQSPPSDDPTKTQP
jgi:hypothetical protein